MKLLESDNERYLRYGFVALYALLFIPFWQPLSLGLIFAIGLLPLVNRLQRGIFRRHPFWAKLVGAGIAMLLLGLAGAGFVRTFSELNDRLPAAERYLGQLLRSRDQWPIWIREHLHLTSRISNSNIEGMLSKVMESFSAQLVLITKALILSTPRLLLEICVFAFSLIFILSNIDALKSRLEAWGIVHGVRSRALFNQFASASSYVLVSTFLIGGIQAAILSIAALIIGFGPLYLVFFISFLFSMIPLLGVGSVGLTMAGVTLLQGRIGATFVLLGATLVASTVDNILRSYFAYSFTKVSALVSLVAILGAVFLLGFPGLFIGPVVQAMAAYTFSHPISRPRGKETLIRKSRLKTVRAAEDAPLAFKPMTDNP